MHWSRVGEDVLRRRPGEAIGNAVLLKLIDTVSVVSQTGL